MAISPINSHNYISFTAQKVKPKKVTHEKQKECKIDNFESSKHNNAESSNSLESKFSYDYPTREEECKEMLLKLAYSFLFAIPFLIIPIGIGQENSNKEQEKYATHPYSDTEQIEGTTPAESLPIVLETMPNETFVIADEIMPNETIATTPQEAKQKDILNINGTPIAFDYGTLHMKGYDKHDGLIDGLYASIEKLDNGTIILTKYDGLSSNDNLIQEISYDINGNIIKVSDFANGKIATTKNYTYSEDLKIETTKLKNAKHDEIDKIVTTYNIYNDIVSKEFKSGNNIVGTFDFYNDIVTIGSEENITMHYSLTLKMLLPQKGEITRKVKLDENSFKCNETAFGSQKYTGTIDGYKVAFDVLNDGICIEYLDNNNSVIGFELYDTNAKLVKSE